MKVVLLGNAGAGKTTLARQLMQREPAARLSLDELAFDGGTARRPLRDSVADAMRFVHDHASWIIEGCYADIVEPLLAHADLLVFLNPGIETCIGHCRARPREPEKFASSAAQDAHLQNLVGWVGEYGRRDDEYGLKRHRALFTDFTGRKVELTDPEQYESSASALLAGGP